MSELIQKNDNRATTRWKLLSGVSALALTAYVSSAAVAKAEDTDRPTVWIELGGQMEMEQGLSNRFTAPFMSIAPTPGLFPKDFFSKGLAPPRYSLGAIGKITIQPENSDWVFSASLRYGRSLKKTNVHNQGAIPTGYSSSYGNRENVNVLPPNAPFADIKAPQETTHAIIDFSAGRDVGVGVWGSGGSSNISFGVRFADFTAKSKANVLDRPDVAVNELEIFFPGLKGPFATFHQYTMASDAQRSFKGAGPSLSWNASAALAGDEQDGKLSLDWGINASVLFGRQKAKTSHSTQAHQLDIHDTYFLYYGIRYARRHTAYPQLYSHYNHSTRSRRVTVPNLGGFVGLSYRYTAAKLSFGYRYDAFLNAMDTGVDARKTSNVTFNGPYASVSIGLGG